VRAIGVPNTQIFARSVSIARAPAITEHAVVAEPIGEHEFIDIFLVEFVANLRIESSIGDIDPLPLRPARSDIGIRHEMHKIELQGL